MSSRQISIRLPHKLFEKVQSKGAMAPFVIEAIEEKLAREQEAELTKSLMSLVDDPNNEIVRDFVAPQQEVWGRVD